MFDSSLQGQHRDNQNNQKQKQHQNNHLIGDITSFKYIVESLPIRECHFLSLQIDNLIKH